jgi:colanic acid/amylovoran biosynthesis glycosyltransferase
MLTVAYLANQFPSSVEPYVGEEIEELRRRGVRVIAGSVRSVEQKPSPQILLRAFLLSCWRWKRLLPLVWRIFFRGREGLVRRVKAFLHTVLGACYAVQLRKRGVRHIHAHHGYYGSWIAMTAARLLDVGFSLTLHGSDLLLHAAYLDTKLQNCTFCLTVSGFNRFYLLERYPAIDPKKVIVSRLGVEVERRTWFPCRHSFGSRLALLSVGRLHPVKDHAFLVRACAQLQAHGVAFECSIAGEGSERRRLESLIAKYGLEDRVTLLGYVPHQQMDSLYARADVVVLTSRSEGIPLVLMEATARGKIVLAPAITGIPELIIPGTTGFLYEAGSLGDFVARLLSIHSLWRSPDSAQPRPGVSAAATQLDWVRYAAYLQAGHNFNRHKSLKSFAEFFLKRVGARTEKLPHENPLLQQIQLPIQRNRGVPVRADESDAIAGARSRAVLHA